MKRALPFIAAVVFTGAALTVGEINRRDAQAIVDRQHARIEQLQLRNGELYRQLLECTGPEITPSTFVPQCLPEEDGVACQVRIGDTGRYEVHRDARRGIAGGIKTLSFDVEPSGTGRTAARSDSPFHVRRHGVRHGD